MKPKIDRRQMMLAGLAAGAAGAVSSASTAPSAVIAGAPEARNLEEVMQLVKSYGLDKRKIRDLIPVIPADCKVCGYAMAWDRYVLVVPHIETDQIIDVKRLIGQDLPASETIGGMLERIHARGLQRIKGTVVIGKHGPQILGK